MMMRKFLLCSVIVLTVALSACTPAQPESAMMDKPTEAMMEKPTEAMMDKPTESMMDKPTEAMMEKPTEAMAMHETPTPATMVDKPAEGAMMDAPAWFGAALTNVNTGETFSLEDFKGKVVLVETMAMWCPTCLRQQKEVLALHEKLGMNEDLVSIALNIDPNENGAALKDYAASNGFDWVYAISPADISRELGNLYGPQFLNPPSAPILIVDRQGVVHPLPFGVKSADDLLAALQPFLDAGM